MIELTAIALIGLAATAALVVSGVQYVHRIRGCMWEDLTCPLCGCPVDLGDCVLVGYRPAHERCVLRREAERA